MSRLGVPLVQGTLEMLILQALRSGSAMHGFEVLRWLYKTSEGALTIEEGSLYPALHRMEQRGWIQSKWGISEKGRRAKYYRLASAGKKQLTQEEKNWTEYVTVVDRILTAARSK